MIKEGVFVVIIGNRVCDVAWPSDHAPSAAFLRAAACRLTLTILCGETMVRGLSVNGHAWFYALEAESIRVRYHVGPGDGATWVLHAHVTGQQRALLRTAYACAQFALGMLCDDNLVGEEIDRGGAAPQCVIP